MLTTKKMNINHIIFTACILLSDSSSIQRVGATYSIAAVDLTNGLMGAAAVTCIKDHDLSLFDALYHSVPGNQSITNTGSVLLAQGLLSDTNDEHMILALELMRNGTDPDLILNDITDPSVDDGQYDEGCEPNYSLRQYGIVNTNGDAASYTGPKLYSTYEKFGIYNSAQEDIQGTRTSAEGISYVFAAQGNIVDENVVGSVAGAFNKYGCDLAESLLLALVRPLYDQKGDVRCTGDGVVGTVAFLHVESADEGVVSLHIDVKYEVNDDNQVLNPLDSLGFQYADWRMQQPRKDNCVMNFHDDEDSDSNATSTAGAEDFSGGLDTTTSAGAEDGGGDIDTTSAVGQQHPLHRFIYFMSSLPMVFFLA